MDPKNIKHRYPNDGPFNQKDPPRKDVTSKEMAQALVKLIAGREQIMEALSVIPNARTRDQLNTSLTDSIRDIMQDLAHREGVAL